MIMIKCPYCDGHGMILGFDGGPALCPECRGDTVVPEEEDSDVSEECDCSVSF